MRLTLVLLLLCAPLARADLDRPRSERLFMCPCQNCKGKWLPNCANRNCRTAQVLRIKLRELERDGKSDAEIIALITAEADYGPKILAAPAQAKSKVGGGRTTYWIPPMGLGLGAGLLALIALRWRRRTDHDDAELDAQTASADGAAPAIDEARRARVEEALDALEVND